MNRVATRACVTVVLLVAMASAQANSDIYLTNSTHETVRIDVRHHGNSDELAEGDEWEQTTTEIAPFATERVLTFNRFSGLESGATYHFETLVEGGSSSVTLRQIMQGTFYGSRISHGARGEFGAPLVSDRAIHRFDTRFDAIPSVLAFKAHRSFGYDDFRYTVTNLSESEPVSGPSELKVLTHNIWALPVIADNIGERLDELPQFLKGVDVLLLQEAFDPRSEDLLLELSDEYPYQTEILDSPDPNLLNGGVVVASRYPIVNTEYHVFPDCVGTDCLTDRGVVYTEIIKDGEAFHVMGTHTASSDSDEARQTRMGHFRQMREMADNQEMPGFEALILGGDFNVNKRRFPGDFARMQSILNATMPRATGYSRATFDAEVNRNADRTSNKVEYLDYVLVANDHRQPAASVNDVRVPRSVSDDLWKVWDLSDHFPVLGHFEFE